MSLFCLFPAHIDLVIPIAHLSFGLQLGQKIISPPSLILTFLFLVLAITFLFKKYFGHSTNFKKFTHDLKTIFSKFFKGLNFNQLAIPACVLLSGFWFVYIFGDVLKRIDEIVALLTIGLVLVMLFVPIAVLLIPPKENRLERCIIFQQCFKPRILLLSLVLLFVAPLLWHEAALKTIILNLIVIGIFLEFRIVLAIYHWMRDKPNFRNQIAQKYLDKIADTAECVAAIAEVLKEDFLEWEQVGFFQEFITKRFFKSVNEVLGNIDHEKKKIDKIFEQSRQLKIQDGHKIFREFSASSEIVNFEYDILSNKDYEEWKKLTNTLASHYHILDHAFHVFARFIKRFEINDYKITDYATDELKETRVNYEVNFYALIAKDLLGFYSRLKGSSVQLNLWLFIQHLSKKVFNAQKNLSLLLDTFLQFFETNKMDKQEVEYIVHTLLVGLVQTHIKNRIEARQKKANKMLNLSCFTQDKELFQSIIIADAAIFRTGKHHYFENAFLKELSHMKIEDEKEQCAILALVFPNYSNKILQQLSAFLNLYNNPKTFNAPGENYLEKVIYMLINQPTNTFELSEQDEQEIQQKINKKFNYEQFKKDTYQFCYVFLKAMYKFNQELCQEYRDSLLEKFNNKDQFNATQQKNIEIYLNLFTKMLELADKAQPTDSP